MSLSPVPGWSLQAGEEQAGGCCICWCDKEVNGSRGKRTSLHPVTAAARVRGAGRGAKGCHHALLPDLPQKGSAQRPGAAAAPLHTVCSPEAPSPGSGGTSPGRMPRCRENRPLGQVHHLTFRSRPHPIPPKPIIAATFINLRRWILFGKL